MAFNEINPAAVSPEQTALTVSAGLVYPSRRTPGKNFRAVRLSLSIRAITARVFPTRSVGSGVGCAAGMTRA